MLFRLVTCVWPLAFASASGCAESPMVPTPPDTFDASTGGFADHVIGFTVSGVPISCVQMGASCGSPAPPCTNGMVDANVVLGMPDNVAFTLGAQDKIEAGFLCSVVIEHGGITPMPSLQIFATIDPGASAVVEVSYDGSAYDTLGTIDGSNAPNPTYSLSRSNLHVIRFVRVTNQGSGGVHVDALQGL